jgi:hypothetical protein
MSSANTLWNVAAQMTIGLGIAFGALSLRLASSLHGAADPMARFTLDDFHWAFACAGVLTLSSLVGYYRLSPHAGRNLARA